jgi:hypothetical protein
MERGKSVLKHYGKPGHKLKRKMVLTGIMCRFLLFLAFNPLFLLRVRMFPNAWKRKKAKTARFIRRFFPFRVEGETLNVTDDGQIFIINHPSLNDPICMILYVLSYFPDREIIVPVNLPWYETVCKYRPKLRKIGVKIVPILTPETAKRLGTNNDIAKIQSALIANYTKEFAETLSHGGTAVVAQQATRKRYVFANRTQAETGEGILSTISLILLGLKRGKLLDKTRLIPVGVVQHSPNAKPKLNLFCTYTLHIGEPISAGELIKVKNDAKYSADLFVLQSLIRYLPVEYHYENVE